MVLGLNVARVLGSLPRWHHHRRNPLAGCSYRAGGLDKYLGDALYAAMVYTILRLFWRAAASARLAASAMAVMTAIELFQLTMIPAHLLANEHVMVRICARLMGTEFSFLDLLTYAVGIACIYLADSSNA